MEPEKNWLTTREIGIDAGHRVPDHGSKCKSIHGHRYRIIAVVEGPLQLEGEQTGMTIDFGFIKSVMMDQIDTRCDHGLILSKDDPFLPLFLPTVKYPKALDYLGVTPEDYLFFADGRCGKLYIIPFTPTAENLAYHWYNLLLKPISEAAGEGKAWLKKIVVWETPNCSAEYPA